MNVLAYAIYLLITYLITVHVGLIFYRNGRIYILKLLPGNEHLVWLINKILLVGYYLINLGYAALMLQTWKTVHSFTGMFLSVFTMTGKIMLILAIIHFINMGVIFLAGQKPEHNIFHHKN